MTQLTIEQALQLALQHHQAGRLQEAEQLYRQILAQQPRHAEALHLLGVLANQAGRNDLAVDLIRQAIALKPSFPVAHSNLGKILRDTGHLDEAIAACRQAIALQPDYPDAHYNLGNALHDIGQLDEAIAAFRQAIALNPNDPKAHNNLGATLQDSDRLDEAIVAFRQAIALNPNYPEAHSNLGNALKDKGLLDEAIAMCRRAIALKPDLAEAHNNLGYALREKRHPDKALAACRQAIALKPGLAEAHNNLGNALKDKGQLDEAIAAFRRAIVLKPDFAEAHNNLGNALRGKGQLDQAIVACRQAIALKSDFAEAYLNLGNTLKDAGQFDPAIALYRQALTYAIDSPLAKVLRGNICYTLLFHPNADPAAILQEHRLWNQQHALPLLSQIQSYSNDKNPNRRLRIGYVSPDFRDHVIGLNLIPLLREHDHQQFEIFCYSDVRSPDDLTRHFQSYADPWRNIVDLSDESVAETIREDRIDILLDLALHMRGNRLMVFARKPAPIQITFAGYPGTTGLSTIDYRLTDPYLDPPGMDESLYSEQTIRLPHTFWCYDPLDGRDVPVNTLPALTNNFLTFGCLNNFCKVNDAVLHLWAKVLQAVPSSRLLLLAPEGSHRQRTLELLEQEGIAPQRIEFISHQPRLKYLELYHRIDLGLDTFPYNGHTTSLDSFWMGVPVITLVGQTVVGRAGLSQLSNLNLPELIASTPEQYLQITTDLAADHPCLAHLRATLRDRMQASPLMDAKAFARDVEAAYRHVWQLWCSANRA